MLRHATFFSILLLFSGFFAPVEAAQGRITGIKIERAGAAERVVLLSDSQLQLKKTIMLGNPSRIVLDFEPVSSVALALPAGYSGVLKGVRFGQFDATTSRVVLDTASPLARPIAVAERSGAGWRYVVPLDAASGAAVQAAPATPATPMLTKDEKPLIVIDAGHGGQDPGALGRQGTREKHVTLAFAKSLRDALTATGRYRVSLTRDSDKFIMLGERVNIARRLHADMFISLHADSNPRTDARGLSIYTISDTASDAETAALAARENSVDELSGMDLGKVDPDVADILLDLATRETKAKSSQLADIVLEAMHPKIPRVTKAHRFAGFRVLKAPDIPSVLIELGFLTNDEDEKRLLTKEYRDLFSASVARGVDAYYVTIKRR